MSVDFEFDEQNPDYAQGTHQLAQEPQEQQQSQPHLNEALDRVHFQTEKSNLSPQNTMGSVNESQVGHLNKFSDKPYPSKIYVHTYEKYVVPLEDVLTNFDTDHFSVATSSQNVTTDTDDSSQADTDQVDTMSSNENQAQNQHSATQSRSLQFTHHFTLKFKDADEADTCYLRLQEIIPEDQCQMEVSYDTLSHPGNLYVRWTKSTSNNEENNEMTPELLRELFDRFGKMTICKIVYDENNESRNYGFVNYTLKRSADLATQELNNKCYQGNDIYINRHISKKERFERLELERIHYTNLYVKNIPEDANKDEIRSLFEKYGQIDSIFLPMVNESDDDMNNKNNENENQDNYGKQNGGEEISKLKGFGFINYSTHEDALLAQTSLNNYEIIPGTFLAVTKAEKKDRNSSVSGSMSGMDSNNHSSQNLAFLARDFNRLGVYAQPGMGTSPRSLFPTAALAGAEGPSAGSSITSGRSIPISSPAMPAGVGVPGGAIRGQPYYYPPNSTPPNVGASNGITPKPQAVYSTASMVKNGLPIAGPNYQDSNLYIKNLPLDIGDEELSNLFSEYGEIVSAKVITSDGVHSKGYGFVCFKFPAQASTALVEMADHVIDENHKLHVSFAQRKDNRVGSNGVVHHYNQNHFNYQQNPRNTARGGSYPMNMMAATTPAVQIPGPGQQDPLAQQAALAQIPSYGAAPMYPYYYYPPMPPQGKTFMQNASSYPPPTAIPMPAPQQQVRRSFRRYNQFPISQQAQAPAAYFSPPNGMIPALSPQLQQQQPADYYGMMAMPRINPQQQLLQRGVRYPQDSYDDTLQDDVDSEDGF